MDKNMIHIDDLVRQRLNGEEQERAGAWLRMRDMLDKDMPVRPVAAFGWGKKILLSAAMLAVIATVGITGYEVSSSFRGTADNSVTAVANPSYASNKPTDKAVTVTTAQPETTAIDNNQSTKNAVAVNSSSDKALNPTTTTTATNVDVKFKSTDKTKNRTKNNNANKTTTNNSIANTSNTVNNNQPQQTTSSANTNNASSSRNNNTASNNTPQLPNEQRTIAGNTPENAPAQRNDEQTLAKTETIQTINQVERIKIDKRTNTASIDNEVVSRGEVVLPVAVATQELAKQETEIMPAAKAPFGPPPDLTPAASENVIASANNSKNEAAGHKHKTKSGTSMWQSVSEYFDRAQYTLGNTKINTGVIGGLNKTFGNYGLLGMNAGLFSDFMFSETWGARLEAKYMHWFNQGTTYRNDYDTYVQEGNTYTKYANDHSFKYSTMYNVDVPVMLQYRPRKSNVSLFAGANFSYFSQLTPEETKRTTLVATGLASAPDAVTPMTVGDFNSRFGMGAMLGMAYNLTDMMQVGLRISQPISDNAKGANAQQVSKDLYRTPNVQLNLSYRFGKDKKED